MALTSKQRAQLRGLAMTEDTIIQIGKGGITENTITQVKDALKARELIRAEFLKTACSRRARLPTLWQRHAPPKPCRP